MQVADVTVARFLDGDRGEFYDTPSDHERLITRPREVVDNATPSGSSLMADLLLRLAVLTGDERGAELARKACDAAAEALARHPTAFGHLLGVADMALYGATEVVVVGAVDAAPFRALRATVAGRYVPSLVLAGGPPTPDSPLALLRGRTAGATGAMAYLCRDRRCEAPTDDAGELAAQLDARFVT
jgi:uncharacterized protein YyaL (SSP411 family)